ncbi:amidohydrolase family protein [Paenibacillus alkaliterrae]|uniref:amidohydrolase family protein n=1 Tax=Paenibacillus alkaliterrae TaxID=320909 RepID=UPI001F35E32E|nr:amidohydrolase family protein [Paenibacillus alkaliterrae]MCF2938544.1 amidohydrolase family protein [Paenibacillus alkaliterrae]
MSSAFWLTNVRLESGYQYENGVVIGTETEICHILIEEGKIKQIVSAANPLQSDFPQTNANHLLALPSFVEKHNHLDKTYLSLPWKSCTPVKSLIERLELEAQELPALEKSVKQRAEKMLELILQAGSTHIRTHVNIDPYVGLKNLEGVRAALETYSDKMTYEIVAFPQQGLLRTQAADLMRQAMREGATLVGGLDPGGVDGHIKGSLQQMMEIAVEANADIDIHIHDPGSIGLYTMKKLVELTEEARWQGRVAISHAFALGDVPLEQASEMADTFAALGISIMSTVPINRPIPPLPLLHEKGVAVALGCDGFYDSWAPFGNGDMLEKAGRLAERFGRSSEKSLAETLGFITGGKTPLNREGERVWPAVGDEASIVLVEASCSAETVARRAKRRAVMYKGNWVAGSLESVEATKPATL